MQSVKDFIKQYAETYDITSNLGVILITIGVAIIFLFIVVTVLDIITTKKKINKYLNNFQMIYYDTHNIKDTMRQTGDLYKEKAQERRALEAGLYYLDHSILHDYQGALAFAERLFASRQINEMHKACINDSQKQKQFLLEKFNDDEVK